MEERSRARLTAAEGRKFGLTLGVAFLAVAGSMRLLRGPSVGVMIVAGVAGALLISALLVPSRLGPLERVWMGFGRLLSRLTSPIVLAILYFLVITPIGLLRRSFGHNALRRRPGDPGLAPGGTWVLRPEGRRRSDLSRQF